MSDSLRAPDHVLGEDLVRVLLGDLCGPEQDAPVARLADGADRPRQVVDSYSYPALIQKIMLHAKHFRWVQGSAFERALAIVRSGGRDPATVLLAGLEKLSLVWFPNIKFWSGRQRYEACWDYPNYMVVHRVGVAPVYDVGLVNTWQTKVIARLVQTKLIFEGKRSLYEEQGLPWLGQVLDRIPASIRNNPKPRVREEKLLDTLVFISAIGIKMNRGGFIKYEMLDNVMANMTMTQRTMQDCRILSRFTLFPLGTRRGQVGIYRLADDIEFQMGDKGRKKKEEEEGKEKEAKKEAVAVVEEGPENCGLEEPTEKEEGEDHQLQEETEPNPVNRDLPFMLPAGTKKRWTEEEEDIIPLGETHALAYQLYLKNCFEAKIAARTLKAFIKKRQDQPISIGFGSQPLITGAGGRDTTHIGTTPATWSYTGWGQTQLWT